MKSAARGKNTSVAEVVGITPRGVWLAVRGREYLLPHTTFPWFAKASFRQVQNVTLLRNHHLHWPDLDVDLELDCLEVPDRYPLIAGVR